ncbi:MAG TPA: ATP-binding protein [Bacteroidales bacterium]|nr:ATP-binding protein [Bacteroidales bacterium]
MKLSKRFLTIPIVIASFSYLFYSGYKDVTNKTLNEFNVQQFTLARQASRGIESFFIYYQRELTFLSKIKYVSDLNEQGKNLLADFFNSHSDQIEAITLVDSKGILLYTYPLNPNAIGRNISDQQHIKTIIETHKPTVSDVFTSLQGFKAIAYHVPIIIDNDYKGSIAILIPIEKLGKRFVENIKTGENGYGWMISESGIELFNPSIKETGKNVKEIFRDAPSVLDLLNKTSIDSSGTATCYLKTGENRNNSDSKLLAAFYRVPLGNTFWTILIFTPEREVYAKLTSFRNRMYLLIALIIIVISTYFYLTLKASNVLKEEKKRKAIEKTLIESEKRFRVMFELSPAGIILIDEKGKVIEVNTAFCDAIGYSRKEIIGNTINLFAKPGRDNDIENNIAKILSGKTLIHEAENIKKDGTTCIVALYETMIILPDGTSGILTVSNDITEKKQIQTELIKAKEKAEESDKLKSAFLANMSHELRTPLNAIIGFSSLMIESGPDKDTLPYSQIILKSGKHLLTLVEDIFDITMIESGQIKIKYENVEIISLLEEVYDIIFGERLKEELSAVKLNLNLDKSPNRKYVVTDPVKLKQVLMNLLRNSLKFTPAGFIEFGFSESREEDLNYLKFYVKDTGIGIDKSHHDFIFNIFRQIDDTHTRKSGGMGIGLSIAKKTVEKLGGKIWLESEPGKGSTFYFTIPDSENRNKNLNLPEKNVTIMEKNYAGKTILIAEDEQSNFDFLKILFNRMNIIVLWAKDGNEAVSLCENDSSIDLVLMDIKMPFLNGFEATRLIKIKRPALPIIAQTAYAMSADKEESINAGCDGYLAKPLKISQIKEVLEKYL